ncbi:MAG: hypothetical protein H6712_05405 [Myxococcales bacterium]|nr:hypothetical protein [Myxococcales bacterium]MCB9713270.1 hypothetical protein [Myxococcales bacterium]
MLVAVACGDDGPAGSGPADGTGTTGPGTTGPGTTGPSVTVGVDSTAGSTGGTTDGTTAAGTTTGDGTSDGTGSGTAGSTGGSSSGTTGDAGSSSDEGGSDSGSSGGGMPFVCPPGGGMPCVSGAECASNECYVLGPLGGVCSECDEDADCAYGCNPGNPISGQCATCCDGSGGCGCETAAACLPGLFCTQLIQVPGIVDISTCSGCSTDLDCAGGDLCVPTYDLSTLRGEHGCLPPGSRANEEGCNGAGSGDLQCASGNCAPASLMGIPVIWACSECDEDADCTTGSCMLPELVINGTMLELVPGACL